MQCEPLTNPTALEWNNLIALLGAPHILQTWEWGEFKRITGWVPSYYVWTEAGSIRAAALLLTRRAPGGLNVLYCPRGPLLDWADAPLRGVVLDDLQRIARSRGAIFLKIDPEIITAWGMPGAEDERVDAASTAALADITSRGWRESLDQIQFRNTVWLDLDGEEVDWLARMKSKTRYNLRLAERKGVRVRAAGVDELPMIYRMYAETSVRDGFVIRGEDYYTSLWRSFMAQDMAVVLLAEAEGEPLAALVLFLFGGRAWYLYGMSRDLARDKMPNYLLQFEAMRRARQADCRWYDLWGAPNVFDESDSMWGVFRFKEGLGGRVVRTPGAWDFTARPLLYRAYTQLLPKVLDVMRRRGRAATQKQVNAPL